MPKVALTPQQQAAISNPASLNLKPAPQPAVQQPAVKPAQQVTPTAQPATPPPQITPLKTPVPASSLSPTPALNLPQPTAPDAHAQYFATTAATNTAQQDAVKQKLADLTKQESQTADFKTETQNQVKQNLQSSQNLADELNAIVEEANTSLAGGPDAFASKSLASAEFSNKLTGLTARAGLIQSAMAAYSGQIGLANTQIDRAASAITATQTDQLGYYETLLQLDKSGQIKLTAEDKQDAQNHIDRINDELGTTQANAEAIKKAMIDPDTAQAYAQAGVTLTDTPEEINQKLGDYAYSKELAATSNDMAAKGYTALVPGQTPPPGAQVVTTTDSKGVTKRFYSQKQIADDKQTAFDNQIKLAQLAIDERRLANDTAAAAPDPAQMLAYGQQYAVTGQIPTGLPKGSFGIVSQIGKELPKQEGTLVSSTTGVAPSTLSATQVDGISALVDIQKKLNEAKTLYASYDHGIIPGLENKLIPLESEQKYQILRGEIVDAIARARSGAALTPDEQATYLSKLPGDFNKSLFLGANGTQKLEGLQSSVTGKLNTTLQTNNLSIYGYSTVNLGGHAYTVGQIVTNANGQQGRVNPDGTITLIQ